MWKKCATDAFREESADGQPFRQITSYEDSGRAEQKVQISVGAGQIPVPMWERGSGRTVLPGFLLFVYNLDILQKWEDEGIGTCVKYPGV